MKIKKLILTLLMSVCLLVNPIMASADYIPTYADIVFIGSKYVTSSWTLCGSYTVPANAKVTGLKGTMSGSYYFYDYLYYYLNGSVQAVIATKLYEQDQVSFYYPVSVSAGNTISIYGSTSASGDTLGLDLEVVLAFDFPPQTLVNQVKTSADNAAANTTYSGYSAGYWSYYGYYYASNANTNASNASTYALNAKNAADTAASQTFYGGKSAAQWASEATADQISPALEVNWANGATITNGSHQQTLELAVSDNVTAPANISLAYSKDNEATWTTFTGTSVAITFPTTPSYQTVVVRATDQAGKITKKRLGIFVI